MEHEEHTHPGPEREARLPAGFPKGLRVLVVDDDSLCLKVVEQMLRKCDYKATTCINGSTALHLLRERPTDFDLVLSDVYMPDMDGFKLLEMVGLEMDLPVIMMSSNGETSTVLRGVTHGAVDFLIKPVRIEELRNVWQHVVRRRRELVKDLDSDEHSLEIKEETAEGGRKRKEAGLSLGDQDRGGDDELNASKKPRVTWSVEMHQKFVGAVNQLGVEKAVPKKILEIMNVDGLTRENVASHLQKYRLYLKRVQGVPPPMVAPPVTGHAHTRNSKSAAAAIPPTSMSGLQGPGASAVSLPMPGVGVQGSGMTNGHHIPGAAGSPSASPGTGPGGPLVPPGGLQVSSPPPGLIKLEPQGRDVAGGGIGPTGPGGAPGPGVMGTESFQQSGAQFPGPGMLGGPMGLGPNPGLSPLLGLPMGMNPMGLSGPMGMPNLSNPLGMLPGMPNGPGLGSMGPMGPMGLGGMNLNSLPFMPGMGMSPLGMSNGMLGPPMGLMPPNMGMGMGIGMGQQGMSSGPMGQQGMGNGPMCQQGMGQQGMSNVRVGMNSMGMQGSLPQPVGPQTPGSLPTPMSLSHSHSMTNGSHTSHMLASAAQAGVGTEGQEGQLGSAAVEAVGGVDTLEMGDLAGQLGELLQGDSNGQPDMAALPLGFDVGDMEGDFAELQGVSGQMGDEDPLTLGPQDGAKDQGMDDLFNFILKS